MAVQAPEKYALLDPASLTSAWMAPALPVKALVAPNKQPKVTQLAVAEPAVDLDFFDLEPRWGGSWAEFFKKFEGHVDGLNRTQISEFKLGNPADFSTYFQEAVREAVYHGLLREIETVTGPLDAKNFNPKVLQRLFLNDLSSRLREIMSPELSQRDNSSGKSTKADSQALNGASNTLEKADSSKLKGKVDTFRKFNLEKIASEYGFEAAADYTSTVLDFFAGSKQGKIFTMTDFYNETAIYPSPVFGRYTINFIDNLIFKAETSGLLKRQNQADGRPVFTVTEGLQEYLLAI